MIIIYMHTHAHYRNTCHKIKFMTIGAEEYEQHLIFHNHHHAFIHDFINFTFSEMPPKSNTIIFTICVLL